jgi:hypothetical protein
MFFHHSPQRDERVVATARLCDADELLGDCAAVLLWVVVLLLAAV